MWRGHPRPRCVRQQTALPRGRRVSRKHPAIRSSVSPPDARKRLFCDSPLEILLWADSSRCRMQIEFQCDLRDYEELFSAQRVKPVGRKILIASLSELLIIAVVFTLVSLGLPEGKSFVFIILCWFALVVTSLVIRRVWIKRDFRGHPNFSQRQVVQADQSGMIVETGVERSEMKWAAYERYQETQTLFLLYLGARSVQAIPKRALSTDQANELRELLRSVLPGNDTSSQRRGPRASETVS
jgi:YcxB-like protein